MSRDTRAPRTPSPYLRQLSWWRVVQLTIVLAVTLAVSQSAYSQTVPVEAPCPPGDDGNPQCGPANRCRIQNNNTGYVLPDNAHGDVLFKVLSEQSFCPENALTFRSLLEDKGLVLHPAMVANRGYHNPQPAGSFSFFEGVTGEFSGEKLELGDFFFGHFTAASIDQTALTSILAPQQAATPDNLLLESVIWDPRKGMFNFYEIRGNGEAGVWFYRGDSLDIIMDIRNLDRNYVPSELQFGEVALGGARLRCSGCHMNGGPIMKELKYPHDSWWRDARPLPLGAMRIAPELQPILDAVVDAQEFSAWIKAGGQKLLASKKYWDLRGEFSGFQEQLRPLFCEQEVNLESDTQPFERPVAHQDVVDLGVVRASTGFFVDPRLLPKELEYVILDYTLYKNALVNFNSLFLDYQAGGARSTDSMDADHAFETPVKSYSDMALVQKMVNEKVFDEEFVADVLAVDITQPMFSQQRCSLLRLLPGSSDNWLDAFRTNLQNSPWPAAQELYKNLTDPKRSAASHRAQALAIVQAVQTNAAQQAAVTGYVRLLAQRRIAVFHDQISQHPQGQIFEPDFRLIFPTMQRLKKDQNEAAYGGVPGQYWLNPQTARVELTP